MPRKARQKSSTGIYHIILRGINRQVIFESKEDGEKFLLKETQGQVNRPKRHRDRSIVPVL